MKKHLAEACRNIIESVITMKKEYSNHWPCYVMERMHEYESEEADEWEMKVTCAFTDDMLTIVLLLERMGTMQVSIDNNYHVTIS